MPRPSLPLSQRDPRSIATIQEVVQHTSLSRDTLDRRHREKYVRLSPNRVGMTVAHALAIAEGDSS
jgi:hypothetical protein